ncbi:prominin-1-A-like [Mizuhopecten yessoensis]|nr:prominin-1-A-like [Mizuhopecten yessoensis]
MDITTSPLEDAVTRLNTSADSLAADPSKTTAAESLRNQSAILQALKDEEVANISKQFDQLKAVVTHLQGYTDIQNRTKNLIDGLTAAQDNFNNGSTRIVNEMLKLVTRNISTFVQTEIDGVKTKIETDIGKCQPLYAATQQASDAFCLVTLDPFNGFWFGLGWGLSAFIFCIVFALCLASLYQREKAYDKFLDNSRRKARHTQELDSPDMEMYQGQAGYNAYGHQDNVPLTSTEAGYQKGGRGRGVPNAAYDNGQQQDPYLRNEAPGSKKRKQYY